VISARAFAYQFLPLNYSGIKQSGMGTVQADSCLYSEHIDTLFTSVGGQEGGFGGYWGGHLIGGPKLTRDCHEFF